MEYFDRQQEAQRLTRVAWILTLAAHAAIGLVLAAIAAALVRWFEWIDVDYSLWTTSTVLVACGTLCSWTVLDAWVRSRRTNLVGMDEATRLGAVRLEDVEHETTLAELSVAAGLPVPSLWCLDTQAINAWSIGLDPTDAAVIVTRGALERLDNAQLRGVLAREISRIVEGDTLLNTRIARLTRTLVSLTGFARTLELHARDGHAALRPSRRAVAYTLHGVNAFPYACAIAVRSVLFRMRGAFADLRGIVLAESTAGVSGAITIATDDRQSCRTAAPLAIEFEHAMCWPDPESWLSGSAWLRTHLDAEERQHRIGLAHGQVRTELTFAEATMRQLSKSPENAIEQLDEFESEHAWRARQILRAIPDRVRRALREPIGAHAVIATLLSRVRSSRHERQRERFTNEGDADAILAARDLHNAVQHLDPATWLSLADLAMPGLRAMDDDQRAALERDLILLGGGDAETLEFFVAMTWLRNVRRLSRPARTLARPTKLSACAPQHAVALMLMLARLGASSDHAARVAFSNALSPLRVPPGRRIFAEPNERIVGLVRDALAEFDGLDATSKRRVLEGATLAVAADSALEPHDIETVRAIGKAIGCAIPPQADLQQTVAQDGPTPQSASDRVLGELWTDEIAEMLAKQ